MKNLKQLAVYLITSIGGMVISHYVPTSIFWYWVGGSLLLGHFINKINYR